MPALCDAESLFRQYYDSCNTCLAFNTSPDVALETQKSYLEPKFSQFINYCVVLGGKAPVTGTTVAQFTFVSTDFDTASLESKWSSIGRAASSEGYIILPTNLVIVTTETISAPTTLPDGRITTLPVTRVVTLPNLSAWTFTVPTSSTPSSTSTPSFTSTPSSTSLAPSGEAPPSATLTVDRPVAASKAWIAGPVVGSIAAIAILGFAGFFFFSIRPRRRAAAMDLASQWSGEKAQLHADSILKPPPQEMEGEINMFPELTANEVPAAELAAEGNGHGPRDGARHEMKG